MTMNDPLLPIEFSDLSSPAAIGRQVLDRCRADGLAWVRPARAAGVDRTFWDEALRAHGERVAIDEDVMTGEPNDGLWSTVAYDPAHPGTFRHSRTAQPLHTDGSYVADPPEIVFLVCRRAATSGGATLFLDGRDLVLALGTQRPSLLAALVHQPMIFAKGGLRVQAPVITMGNDGVRLRWNVHALADGLAPEVRAIATELCDFLGSGSSRLPIRSVRLEAGDAVFFHDDRLLHGREAFNADHPDGRFLWKGGLRPHGDTRGGP